MVSDLRVIAMYLPQFHDCPHNSKWWGRGFTEWNNVRAAKPLFSGHQQPRIPSGGYYSLDNIEIIQAQADQARAYGIDGFAIYHYWYQGIRPLAKPLDLILANPDLNLSFSLCWANHSWTRSWKNRLGSLDVLIEQTYEPDDLARAHHEDFLCRVFSDRRYIRLQGKPLLQIYLPESIPELPHFIDRLRLAVQRQLGIEIHVSAMLTSWQPDWSYLNRFDSATLFQPSLALFSPVELFATNAVGLNVAGLASRLRASPAWLKRLIYLIQDRLPQSHKLFGYEHTWERLIMQYEYCARSNIRQIFPMAFVDFDNTPRYCNRARVFEGYSHENFKAYFSRLLALAREYQSNGTVFINAWNEWGEGMYLEPDTYNGLTRLEIIRELLNSHEQTR